MRPEPFDWASFFSARSLQALAAIFLALFALQFAAARAAQHAPQSPAAPIYDRQSFMKELERLDEQLDKQLDGAGKSPEILHSFRESLPKSWVVDAGGRRYNVPTDLLVSRLAQAEGQPALRGEQMDQARIYLRALAEETALLSIQPPAPAESARAKLNAILARSEYRRTREESWWEKVRARISEILLDNLERIFRRVGGQVYLGNVLLWIGISVAAVFIAYWIFRRWFRTARMQEMALQAAAVRLRTWQEWLFTAREAAGHADYRMAIHCAYWAGIMRLQDVGALSPDRAKTPREYLRALTKSKLVLPETLATRQQALSLLTSRLEKTWYGYQTATEADFRDSLIQLETLGCRQP